MVFLSRPLVFLSRPRVYGFFEKVMVEMEYNLHFSSPFNRFHKTIRVKGC